MTIIEALQSKTGYPVEKKTLEVILLERGLEGSDTFTAEIAKGKSFIGSVADLYMFLYTAPNISEGGYSVSVNDKDSFKNMAYSYYHQIGEDDKMNVGGSCSFIGYRN